MTRPIRKRDTVQRLSWYMLRFHCLSINNPEINAWIKIVKLSWGQFQDPNLKLPRNLMAGHSCGLPCPQKKIRKKKADFQLWCLGQPLPERAGLWLSQHTGGPKTLVTFPNIWTLRNCFILRTDSFFSLQLGDNTSLNSKNKVCMILH